MTLVLVYVTYPNEEEAIKVVNQLLQEKLIACANLIPIKSMYYWNNKLENNPETVSILKTTESLFAKVKEEIERLHSYQVPCILKISTQANHLFDQWLHSQILE